jgi:predicted house-cleaning noncanonical NTP pyrophosphatase (MazG superfamily)
MPERPYLDKVGELLGNDGRVEYKSLDDAELHVQLLRDKLIEEALEYYKNPSLGEAADVLQALLNLVDLDLDKSREQLEEARIDKYVDRGGFEIGTGMFVTTTAPLPIEPGDPDEDFEVGDLVEVVGGVHDQRRGEFAGVADAEAEEDWLVRLEGTTADSSPANVRIIKKVDDG